MLRLQCLHVAIFFLILFIISADYVNF